MMAGSGMTGANRIHYLQKHPEILQLMRSRVERKLEPVNETLRSLKEEAETLKGEMDEARSAYAECQRSHLETDDATLKELKIRSETAVSKWAQKLGTAMIGDSAHERNELRPAFLDNIYIVLYNNNIIMRL